MEIKVYFPVMARAIRKGIKGECRLLGGHAHTQAVREVSSLETEVAVPAVEIENPWGQKATAPELRLHDDRLYRYLAPVRGKGGELGFGLGEILAKACENTNNQAEDYVFTTVGKHFVERRNRSPLSRPVFTVFRDRLEAMGMGDTSSRNRTVPKGNGWNSYQPNEDAEFADLARDSEWVNPDDVDEAFAMHRAQSDRLLVIDDGLWYETKPPCIAVETDWKAYRNTQSNVVMRYRYLPDVMDHMPSTLYFPLHAIDQARETAAQITRKNRMMSPFDMVGDFLTCDHPAFDFNTTENLVTRTGHALAGNLLFYSAIRPDKIDAATGDWLRGISEMFHAHNPVLGRDVDFATAMPAMVEAYMRMSPPHGLGLHVLQKRELRKILPDVVERLDDLPISVHGLGAGASFAP